ncbi:hypothetical protein E8E14_003117 [Neopestalotiopsis sp. 37M]|nr:hypothetical protein E8E14_003117 [Neopestalotiopsis sp. 37M]
MASTSSRRTSSTTTTTAPPLAMTTPFVAPPGCVDQYRTTSFISSFGYKTYTYSTFKVLASDSGDSRFAACQPPGWNVDAHFQFSPAVCPSGFTAYRLDAVTYEMTVSTAYCCSSGFTFGYFDTFESTDAAACIKDIAESTTGASSSALKLQATAATSPTSFPRVFSVHNAWQISWESSDVATLSPSPPLLPCFYSPLSSWIPGETVDPSFYASACPNDGESHWSDSSVQGFFFIVIGLPIIGFLGIVTCIAVCCCRRRRRKRAKARAKAGRQPPATSVGTTSLARE